MTIQRLSPFGFPMRGRPQQSATTVRMVPLTQGMSANRPLTNEPPGSAISLLNFLPIDGHLLPRSRLSSIGTLPRGGQVLGMTEVVHTGTLNVNRLWAVGSGSTQTDNLICFPTAGGAISQASYVSTNGIGTKPDWTLASAKPSFAFYPSVFDTGTLDDLLLIALPKPINSAETILAAGLTGGGAPIYSYLTNAPQAKYVIAYDNYVIAWNVMEGAIPQQRRVQWSSRGDPGVWAAGTGNAGFEDLLSMKGYGTGVAVLDSRLILFSTNEIWYGVPQVFPAQFVFNPLDTTIGVPGGYASTIVNTELGVVFLGSDSNLRVLPRGGGLSVIVNPSIGVFIRDRGPLGDGAWGWYDESRRLYHLMPFFSGGVSNSIVVNLNTGEWGTEFTQINLESGCFAGTSPAEEMFAGDFSGRFYSMDSRLRNDTRTANSSFPVTSQFRSEIIGKDLPDGHRQVMRTNLDYRATSSATGMLSVYGDAGNTFPTPAGVPVTLDVALNGKTVMVDKMEDGPLPVIDWQSDTTGYELHRASVTMALRGRL